MGNNQLTVNHRGGHLTSACVARLHRRFQCAAAALWLFCLAGRAGCSDLYHNADAGFHLTKPAAWHFLPQSVVAKNLALPRLREKDLENAIRSKPEMPFLIVTKFKEPYEGLNPSVQVSFRTQGDLAGKGARVLLERSVARLKENFADYNEVEKVTETLLDGRPAARMAASYTVRDAAGAEFKTLARMWVVPRGDYMLTIGTYGPTSGSNVSDKEFQSILDSIKLTAE